MRSATKEGLQVLRRVRDFLVANEVTTALGPVTKHVEGLSVVIDRLSAYAVEQDASARAASAGTRTARELSRALRKGFMRPVSQLGKTLFPNDAAIRRALRMPLANDYEGLFAAAKAMAERAAEHKERFVAAGFGEDFVDRVRQAAEQLRKALDARAVHRGNRSSGSAGMRDQMARGRDIVRLLDTLVSHEWANAPDRLARWNTLSRFIRSATPDLEVVPGAPGSVPATQDPANAAAPANGGAKPSTPSEPKPVTVLSISPAVQPAVSGETATKVA